MINIYKTVRAIYDKRKAEWTNEREQGFRECLLLFLTGIEKHPAFNAYIENEDLKDQIELLLRRVKQITTENTTLNTEVQDLKTKNLQLKVIKEQNTLKKRKVLSDLERELSIKNNIIKTLNGIIAGTELEEKANIALLIGKFQDHPVKQS